MLNKDEKEGIQEVEEVGNKANPSPISELIRQEVNEIIKNSKTINTQGSSKKNLRINNRYLEEWIIHI